jgi:predicted phosphodiesterase
MECITRHTQYDSRTDVFRLIAIADVHLGNLHANEKLLKQLAQEIQTQPFTYWIGLGDMCEFINLRDPRFDPSELAPWLDMDDLKDLARAETARFLDIMRPCASKCLGLVEGNHEESIRAHSEADVYSALIEGLADKEHEHRLEHRGIVSWVFDRGAAKANSWTLRIHATHGSGGGQSAGSVSNKLLQIADQMDGIDVVLMGHHHKPDWKPISRVRAGKRKSEVVTIHTIACPALCSDMRYADRKDYRAYPTGYAELLITPNTHHVEVRLNVG